VPDAVDPVPNAPRLPAPKRRGPRPDVAWRDRILAAARQQFSEHGYEAATVRRIARAAGVDPKLIHYYFGTKEELFAAAIAEPFRTSRLLDLLTEAPPGPGDPAEGNLGEPGSELLSDADIAASPGERYLAAVLTALEDDSFGPAFVSLVRGLGTHEPSRRVFVRLVTTEFLVKVAPRLPEPGPRARAALVGSQMLGLVMARYILRAEPLVALSIDQIAATVGPVIDHYLYGQVHLADPIT
jgi:AcrR family transcriptional regulator